MGFIDRREPIIIQLYSEVLQKFRLAARGHGPVLPPAKHRARIETYFDPMPVWYPPFEDAASAGGDFPLHAVTQRPMYTCHLICFAQMQCAPLTTRETWADSMC